LGFSPKTLTLSLAVLSWQVISGVRLRRRKLRALNIRFQIFITICVAVAIGLGVGVASFYWEFNQQGEVPAIWPPNWPTALVAVTAFLLASYFAARFLSRQQEDHERVHGELLAKLAETSASAAQYHADLEEKVSERTANLKEEIEERRRVARALNYRCRRYRGEGQIRQQMDN